MMSPSLDHLSAEFNRIFPLVQAPPPPPPPPKPAPAPRPAPVAKPAAPAGGAVPASATPAATDGATAAPVSKPAATRPAASATSPAAASANVDSPAAKPVAVAKPAPRSAETTTAGAAPSTGAVAAQPDGAAAAKPAATPRPAVAAVVKPAAPPAPPPEPVMVPPAKLADRAFNGYDLDATVPSADIVKAAEMVDQAGFTLDCITGVDWIDEKQMEVVYDFFHTDTGKRVVIRTRIPRERPELPTISHLYAGASWHERETHDFFGIVFVGHPHLVPILLEEDADYHPLRKDYPGAAPFQR